MSKELCFNIEGINLYLEQILVDYMDVPIFFLCSGKKQYYVVLCTDVDELNYMVLKLPLVDVYNLLHGKMAMRDIILKQKEYWDVISGENVASDRVVKKEIDSVDITLLPEENACFEVLTEQIQLFVQGFDNEFFATKHFTESDKKADINELFENLSLDAILKDVEQFTRLLDCKIEKSLRTNVYWYDEKMNSVKTTEVTFGNWEEVGRIEIDDLFKLEELYVNHIADAA